jgi:hypothetical protein
VAEDDDVGAAQHAEKGPATASALRSTLYEPRYFDELQSHTTDADERGDGS